MHTLQEGIVATTPSGTIRFDYGGLGTVAYIHCGSKRYAVKCFTSPVPSDDAARYQRIDARLANLSYTWVARVRYLDGDEGFWWPEVGDWYPLLRMDWMRGRPLDVVVRAAIDRRDQSCL